MKHVLNRKVMIILLKIGLIKRTCEYFLKPKSLVANVKVELDLSNFATKADLENLTRFDTSEFGNRTDLANLRPDVDKLDSDKFKNIASNSRSLKGKVDNLDIGKLETNPFDLSKLSDIVKMKLLKRMSIMN